MAAGYDGSIRIDSKINAKGFNSGIRSISRGLTGITSSLKGLSVALGIAFGTAAIVNFGKASIKATTELTNAMTGLKSILDGQGRSFKNAQKFINEYVSDGLIPATNAITAYKNLASRGYTDTQIEQVLVALKDSAAFGRQASYSLGDAVMTATEGLKNENSILVDNAGVTKNVAKMWDEYAKSIGTTANNLTKQQKIQAEVTGILEETKFQTGDAAKIANSYSGEVLKLGFNFNNLKIAVGNALIPLAQAVLPSINAIIVALTRLANVFAQVTTAIFGKQTKQQEQIAKSGTSAAKAQENLGKATKKAGKEAKGALAGFDELNVLAKNTADAASGATDELGEDIGIGEIETKGEMDIETSKVEEKLNRIKDILAEIYDNWGLKDFFKGFRDGLDLINFDNIKTNLQTAFSGLSEIAQAALQGLQPIFQAAGQTLGTMFKYGIAIAGNLFEPISLGWANFISNMKEPIQNWIMETSQTISNGFNNLTSIFEILGESWLSSINKYKDAIAKATEDTLTNIAETIMLAITIIADTFEIITSKLKEFTEENETEIQGFTDSILGIFTDVWDLINKVWEDALNSIKNFWDTWGKDIVAGVMDVVKAIGEWFLYLWNDLVKPIWDEMMKWLKKIWEENLKGIIDEWLGFAGRIGKLVLDFWNNILKPLVDKILQVLVPAFRNSFKLIIDIVGSAVNAIAGVIKNLLKVFNGIIDFVVGVFTGDWKRAWEGIKGIFSGIVGTLETIFKGVINGIVAIANSFIRFWNGIELNVPTVDIPLVGEVGGFRIGVPKIPEIPALATGAVIPPNSEFLAILGDQKSGRNLEAPEGLIRQIMREELGSIMQSGGDIHLTVKIGEDTLTEKVISNINRQNRISGKTVIQV